MGWFAAVLVSVAVAACSVGLINLMMRKTVPEPDATEVQVGKWTLPIPGGNLNLYRRVTTLLDELESERDQARRERNEARIERNKAVAEQNRLRAKLGSAQEILRAWTHPGMEIRIKERSVARQARLVDAS